MKFICPALVILMSIAGCSVGAGPAARQTDTPTTRDSSGAPKYNLTLYDGAGMTVAVGELEFPAKSPPLGETFLGAWRLKSSTNSFPSVPVSTQYSFRIDANTITINLEPGAMDNNVTLFGSARNDAWSGKWFHAKYAGAEEMGTFTLNRR